jgi:acylphosphatase
MTATTERREVFYSGRVQGVGFRYRTKQIAQGYAVAGFVRNLPDRRVHLVAEGPPEQLNQFLAELADVMADYIRDTQLNSYSATGEFASFQITH